MFSNKPTELVCIIDPAVDKSKTDIKKYIDTRDLKHVVLKEGKEPARFFARRLSTRVFNQVVEGATTDVLKFQLAFQFGVSEIRNLTIVDESENASVLSRYMPDGEGNVNTGFPSHYTDEQIDKISPAVVREIGSLIYYASFLGMTSGEHYDLPPSLHSILARQIVRDAAETQDEQSSMTKDD